MCPQYAHKGTPLACQTAVKSGDRNSRQQCSNPSQIARCIASELLEKSAWTLKIPLHARIVPVIFPFRGWNLNINERPGQEVETKRLHRGKGASVSRTSMWSRIISDRCGQCRSTKRLIKWQFNLIIANHESEDLSTKRGMLNNRKAKTSDPEGLAKIIRL